jgi:hypothetical protein
VALAWQEEQREQPGAPSAQVMHRATLSTHIEQKREAIVLARQATGAMTPTTPGTGTKKPGVGTKTPGTPPAPPAPPGSVGSQIVPGPM